MLRVALKERNWLRRISVCKFYYFQKMSSKKTNTYTDRSKATKPKSSQGTPSKYAPKEGFNSAGKHSPKPKSVHQLLTTVGDTITQAATVIVDQVNRLIKPECQPSPKNINYDKENHKSVNKGKSGKRGSRSRQDAHKRSTEGKQTKKCSPKSNGIFFDIELTQPRNGDNNHRLVKRFSALPSMEPTGKAANCGSHLQHHVTRKTSQGKVETQKPSNHFSSPPILQNKSKGAPQTSIPTRWNTTNPKFAGDKTNDPNSF